MRFLMTTSKADPPDDKLVAEMDRLVEEMTRKGVLLAAGGLDPVGTCITSSGGKARTEFERAASLARNARERRTPRPRRRLRAGRLGPRQERRLPRSPDLSRILVGQTGAKRM